MAETYCAGCGALQTAGAAFCATCGRRHGEAAAQTWESPPQYAQRPAALGTNGYAIASLVCSLVSCGIGSILGVVFGKRAQREIAVSGQEGDGLAKAGIIIGWIGIAGMALFFLVFILALAVGDTSSTGY